MTGEDGTQPSTAFQAVVRGLALDRAGAEIVSALQEAGVRAMVLKGPTIAKWLYTDGAVRPYEDIDVIVDPRLMDVARPVLEALGYEDLMKGTSATEQEHHHVAKAWLRRSDQMKLDLHRSIWGPRASDAAVFEVLWRHRTPLRLGGAEVPVLAEPARAVHLALHAAQHGPAEARPLEDLRRGIVALGDEGWRRAVVVAEELTALPAMIAGLELIAEGQELVQRLALSSASSPESFIRASGSSVALSLERLATRPGLLPKVRLLIRELFPTPAFMRIWSPLAARGPVGLVLAYCYRPISLFVRLIPAGVIWLRARSSGRLGTFRDS